MPKRGPDLLITLIIRLSGIFAQLFVTKIYFKVVGEVRLHITVHCTVKHKVQQSISNLIRRTVSSLSWEGRTPLILWRNTTFIFSVNLSWDCFDDSGFTLPWHGHFLLKNAVIFVIWPLIGPAMPSWLANLWFLFPTSQSTIAERSIIIT